MDGPLHRGGAGGGDAPSRAEWGLARLVSSAEGCGGEAWRPLPIFALVSRHI